MCLRVSVCACVRVHVYVHSVWVCLWGKGRESTKVATGISVEYHIHICASHVLSGTYCSFCSLGFSLDIIRKFPLE